MRRAVELGVDHMDTAQSHGFGFANRVIREAPRPEADTACGGITRDAIESRSAEVPIG